MVLETKCVNMTVHVHCRLRVPIVIYFKCARQIAENQVVTHCPDFSPQPFRNDPGMHTVTRAGVWVWVGSSYNWTGVVGCACAVYATAMTQCTHTHSVSVFPDFCVQKCSFFSSLWASRGARGSGQRYREAVWAALALGARVFVTLGISWIRAEVP